MELGRRSEPRRDHGANQEHPTNLLVQPGERGALTGGIVVEEQCKAARALTGQQVRVMVRPERFVDLAVDPNAVRANRIDGRVTDSAYIGVSESTDNRLSLVASGLTAPTSISPQSSCRRLKSRGNER